MAQGYDDERFFAAYAEMPRSRHGLRAAGDVRFTMISSVLSMWIFRIAFSYLLAQGLQMGLMGVWSAMFIDWFVRAALFTWRFFSNRWRGKAIR